MLRMHEHLRGTLSVAKALRSAGRILVTAVVVAVIASPLNVCVLSASSVSDSLVTQLSQQTALESWEERRESSEVTLTSASSDLVDADRRKALRSEDSRWPNAVVPYYIFSSIDNISPSARQIIQDAMGNWENETCIRFAPANILKDRNAIVFRKGEWCSSIPGRRGGWQPIHVAAGCFKVGSIVHELGHAIGWVHEHARPDRDDYLEIVWKKVRSADASQFEKNNDSYINTFGVPYDYGSIMHYNGSSGTIRALDPKKQKLMGQRVKLSFYDTKLANLMYTCAERNKCDLDSVKCTGEGYVGPKCTCVCPDDSKECTAESEPQTPLPDFLKYLLKKTEEVDHVDVVERR